MSKILEHSLELYKSKQINSTGTKRLSFEPFVVLLSVDSETEGKGLRCFRLYLNKNVHVSFIGYRLVGLVVRRPPREWKIPGSNPSCAEIFFRGRVTPVTSKLALQWLPSQAPGVIGSALGLVGPVSDWVRSGLQLLTQCSST